jgi:hypothetical protein
MTKNWKKQQDPAQHGGRLTEEAALALFREWSPR